MAMKHMFLFCLGLVVALAITAMSDARSYADTTLPARGLCAHRGDQGIGPENTVPAFIGAAIAGAQQIELDVQKTKDGKLVIMHDNTVDRTTDGKGKIVDLTLDEIKALNVKLGQNRLYESVKVPTFEEALDSLPTNVWINVHVKPGEGIAEDALKVVMAKGRVDQCLFAVLQKEMESLRATCPEVKICCMDRKGGVDKYIQRAIEWKCEFIQLNEPYTKEQIAALKAANIKINYFKSATVGTDDPAEIRAMLADGVDFPLVNHFSEAWNAGVTFDGVTLNELSAEEKARELNLLPAPKMAKRGLCAHRGDQGVGPENTVPSFVAAAKAGAQQVELDVQLTKDGKLVIMHDLTVDRTTDGKGAVKDLTFDEIRALDAGVKYDAQYAGTKVPTFEEALDCLPRNIWVNIHVKPGEGIAAAATKTVVERGRLAQCFIGVENKQDLDDARSVFPDVKIAFLTGDMRQDIVDNVIAWKCDFVQSTKYQPEFIKQYQDAGVTMNFFGTDDFDKIKSLLTEGVCFPLVNLFAKDWPAAAEIEGLELNQVDPNYLNDRY